MLLHLYPARIRNAAQGAAQRPIYTKTPAYNRGFSMRFSSEPLSARVRGFSAWVYKYPTRGFSALLGSLGPSEYAYGNILPWSREPGAAGGSWDKLELNRFIVQKRTFFQGSGSAKR